jgi:hypothetical protein
MAYETVTIEVENEDVDEWKEQLEKMFLAREVEDIWRLDDYKTVIEFETKDKAYLLNTLKQIGERQVMWYEVDR